MDTWGFQRPSWNKGSRDLRLGRLRPPTLTPRGQAKLPGENVWTLASHTHPSLQCSASARGPHSPAPLIPEGRDVGPWTRPLLEGPPGGPVKPKAQVLFPTHKSGSFRPDNPLVLSSSPKAVIPGAFLMSPKHPTPRRPHCHQQETQQGTAGIESPLGPGSQVLCRASPGDQGIKGPWGAVTGAAEDWKNTVQSTFRLAPSPPASPRVATPSATAL